MANANISVVTLAKTFDEWRVATNDLITDRNILRNSNYVKDDGELSLANGKLLISRAAGGVTFTNDNDALIGGTITATDLVTIDDAVIGANAYLTSSNSVLFANNNVQTRNLTSNSLITAANVNASGFLIVRGLTRDSQNNILNVNSTLYMSNSGAINVGNTLSANDTIIANKLTGTGLQVTANASITGNLLVSSNGIFSQNISVADTVNTLNARTTGLIVLGVANVATGNIVTANIATLNVNAAGAFANVANLRVSNSNTANAIIDTLSVLTRANFSAINVATGNILVANIATLNVNAVGSVANIATLNVNNQFATLINVASANISTLEVVSLTVKDPIIAPSESDSSSYRLRVAQTTRGDGFFGVRLGSAANGNAWITFDTSSGNVWRLTSNSTEGLYYTVLSTRNLSTSVSSTDTANAATPSAVKTAYDQATTARNTANSAYDAANTAGGSSAAAAYNRANVAANSVAVYTNDSFRMANAILNFNNSASINVVATPNATNQFANVEFSINPTSTGIAGAYNQANVATTAAAAAMNYRGAISTDYSDSNAVYRNATANGYYLVNGSTDSRSTLVFSSGGSTGTVQLEFGYNDVIRWRSKVDSINWTTFRQIWHSGNYDAYGAANTANINALNAYGQANTAANAVSVSANSGSTLTSRRLNFVNTSTVTVSVTANPDGSNANVSFNASAPTSPGGSNQQIQYNNGGTFGGASLFVFNPASGDVGIGTASPFASGLTIGNDSVGTATPKLTFSTTTGERASLQMSGASGEMRLTSGYTGWGGYQTFYTNGGERLRIETTGNVGIGTSSALSKLHVTNTLAGSQSLKSIFKIYDMYNSGVNGQFFQVLGGPNGINLLSNYGDLVLGAREDGTETHSANLVIQRISGNVGIGVTSPRSNLEIKSTSGSVGFNYGSLGSAVRGNMYYDTDGTGWKFQIGKLQSGTFTSQMQFADNGEVTIPNALTVANTYTQNVQIVGISQSGYLSVDGISVRDASILNSGTIASARLGSGTANSVTYLAGDSTYKPLNNFLRQASAGYVGGNVFVSSSTPTAGAVGDIWIEI
jgi:hypothetical protein